MLNKEDVEIGATVYPRPTTKTARRECYLGLAAVLVSTDAWPMVKVRIFDDIDLPEGRTVDLHKDDVGLTRRTVKKEKHGDAVGSDDDGGVKVRKMGRAPALIDPASGYEDGVLF